MKKKTEDKDKNKTEGCPVAAGKPQTAPKQSLFSSFEGDDASLSRFWYSLRESVPIIDAAVLKLVRLTGGFTVRCPPEAAAELEDFVKNVSVNGISHGLGHFIDCFFEQLLTCGTAVGEIVTNRSGVPAGLYNAPLENLEFRRAKNGFDAEIFIRRAGESLPAPDPGALLSCALDPRPGRLCGTSLLRGLPCIAETLLKIYSAVGANWDRIGNVRFAVTYEPPPGAAERAFAGERAEKIASEWSKAMSSDAVRDFVAVGNVQIRAIGSDCAFPDSEVPVRQLIEQITAKTGIPPFMLGLNWSSTERMSDRQTDILTTELWAYRRLLTPVIEKICRRYLAAVGCRPEAEVVWDEITLLDEAAAEKQARHEQKDIGKKEITE